MEFARRTYRMMNPRYSKSISFETIDSGKLLRITVSLSDIGNNRNKCISLDLSKNIAKCIRDHINAYLDE